MALSRLEKAARQRLRRITADNAEKVISKDIYWSVPFLDLYLNRCIEVGLEKPRDGLSLAVYAPQLSRRIGVDARPGEYKSKKQKRSYLVLALAVLASSHRRAGNYDEAEQCFKDAFDIEEQEEISLMVRVELLFRYGGLRTSLCHGDAIEYLNRAVEIGEGAGFSDSLAAALNARGHWYANHQQWARAAHDFSKALLSANKMSSKGKRAILAATANLAFSVGSGSVEFDAQTSALERVREVRSQIPRLSFIKCRLFWMEGLLHRNMCFWEQAIRTLRRARRGMLQLGEPGSFVLVSLDLAAVFIVAGNTKEYERLRKDTATAFDEMTTDGRRRQAVVSALNRWQDMPVGEPELQLIKRQIESIGTTGISLRDQS